MDTTATPVANPATRRYFVNDADYRARSCYAGQVAIVDMYLRAGWRECANRAEYLAFRRAHRPAGEHHVPFTKEENTAIAEAARRQNMSEEHYIRVVVTLNLKQCGWLRTATKGA